MNLINTDIYFVILLLRLHPLFCSKASLLLDLDASVVFGFDCSRFKLICSWQRSMEAPASADHNTVAARCLSSPTSTSPSADVMARPFSYVAVVANGKQGCRCKKPWRVQACTMTSPTERVDFEIETV